MTVQQCYKMEVLLLKMCFGWVQSLFQKKQTSQCTYSFYLVKTTIYSVLRENKYVTLFCQYRYKSFAQVQKVTITFTLFTDVNSATTLKGLDKQNTIEYSKKKDKTDFILANNSPLKYIPNSKKVGILCKIYIKTKQNPDFNHNRI